MSIRDRKCAWLATAALIGLLAYPVPGTGQTILIPQPGAAAIAPENAPSRNGEVLLPAGPAIPVIAPTMPAPANQPTDQNIPAQPTYPAVPMTGQQTIVPPPVYNTLPAAPATPQAVNPGIPATSLPAGQDNTVLPMAGVTPPPAQAPGANPMLRPQQLPPVNEQVLRQLYGNQPAADQRYQNAIQNAATYNAMAAEQKALKELCDSGFKDQELCRFAFPQRAAPGMMLPPAGQQGMIPPAQVIETPKEIPEIAEIYGVEQFVAVLRYKDGSRVTVRRNTKINGYEIVEITPSRITLKPEKGNKNVIITFGEVSPQQIQARK